MDTVPADRLKEIVDWPGQGVSRVPYRVYTDAEVYAAEQRRLFRGPTSVPSACLSSLIVAILCRLRKRARSSAKKFSGLIVGELFLLEDNSPIMARLCQGPR